MLGSMLEAEQPSSNCYCPRAALADGVCSEGGGCNANRCNAGGSPANRDRPCSIPSHLGFCFPAVASQRSHFDFDSDSETHFVRDVLCATATARR